jgi:hypothetical protein
MIAYVEIIIFGGLQHTKYSELGTYGLVYSLMYVQISGPMINVINSQASNN